MEKCASEMICRTADLTCDGQPLGIGIVGSFRVVIVPSANFCANGLEKHDNIQIIKEMLSVESTIRFAGPAHPSKVRKILKATVQTIPRESTHWSLRLMAEYAQVSKHQVTAIWKAADLKPHRIRSFKISNDPDFAEKVIDVVGLYMDPPDNALVLSVDEKTQIQALDRTQPMLQLKPGQVERRTHDYKRHGTASLFAAFDVASGEVMGRITKRHRAIEFLAFLRQIEQAVHPDLDVHLILDNSSTHKTQKIRNWFIRRPRFHLHFTPTSASWLNAVETWFSQLERRSLYRNSFTSVQELRNEIRRYIRVHNQHLAKPFKWRANATSILDKVERAQRSIDQC